MAFHLYARPKYASTLYAADATFWVKALTEAIGSTDTDSNTRAKALTDALTSTDAKAFLSSRAASEFLFLLDAVSKSVLNKGLPETVRINDWLQIERKRNSQWGN